MPTEELGYIELRIYEDTSVQIFIHAETLEEQTRLEVLAAKVESGLVK